MNYKFIAIAFLIILAVFALYLVDYSKNKQNYLLAYNTCLEREMETKNLLKMQFENAESENTRMKISEKLNDYEACNGCYNECGGCRSAKKDFGILTWAIEKFKGNYACAAVCIPYCMEAP